MSPRPMADDAPWSVPPLAPTDTVKESCELMEKAITPFLTFWQSEFVRLRLQYQYAERNFIGPQGPEYDNRAWVQVTFAAGPHRHEAY